MPYRVEYASTNRAGCKGPKPCSGTKIEKGTIRFGTVVEIQGNTSFQWRHFGCMTEKQVSNIKNELAEPEDLDGYEDLTPEDQAKFRTMWETGHVPEDEVMMRGHDPLSALSIEAVKDRARTEDIDISGLKKKDELVAALRAHYGGMSPVKLAKADPLESLTAADLKARAEAAGLPKTGAKGVLVARLREHYGPVEDEVADGGSPSKVKKEIKSEEGSKPAKRAAAGKKAAPKKRRDETSDEESAEESESASESPADSSSDEESAQSSDASSEEDVKPQNKGRGKGRATRSKDKKPAKKVKREVSDEEEEEDVKPKRGRGQPKKVIESASEQESSPAKKKGRKLAIKSEDEKDVKPAAKKTKKHESDDE